MYPDDTTRLRHMRDAAREAIAFASGKNTLIWIEIGSLHWR